MTRHEPGRQSVCGFAAETPVEAGRVVDRAKLSGNIGDAEVVQLHQELRRRLRSFAVVALSEPILDAAAGALPTQLATLAALHLATALAVTRTLKRPLFFATHDAPLAAGARASGLEVIGSA